MNDAKMSALYQALTQSWTADTAYKGDWSTQNPSRNQCAVTALVVQKHLGGVLIRGAYRTPDGEAGTHYWNRIDEDEIDFTSSQFPIGTTIEVLSREISAKSVLANPDTASRFELLDRRTQACLAP